MNMKDVKKISDFQHEHQELSSHIWKFCCDRYGYGGTDKAVENFNKIIKFLMYK